MRKTNKPAQPEVQTVSVIPLERIPVYLRLEKDARGDAHAVIVDNPQKFIDVPVTASDAEKHRLVQAQALIDYIQANRTALEKRAKQRKSKKGAARAALVLFLLAAWASNAHSQGHGSLARIGGFSGGEGYGDYWDAQRKQLQASAARAAVVTRTPEEWRRIYEKQAQLIQAAAAQREAEREQEQARKQREAMERLRQIEAADKERQQRDEEIAKLEKSIAAEKRWMRERAILVARIAKRNAEDAAFELNQQNTWPQWFKRLSLPAFFGVGLVTAAAHFWSATFKALQRWLLARQIAR